MKAAPHCAALRYRARAGELVRRAEIITRNSGALTIATGDRASMTSAASGVSMARQRAGGRGRNGMTAANYR